MTQDEPNDDPRRRLDDEKLALEVRKLRGDLSWLAKVTAFLIPGALLLITAAQLAIAFFDWQAKESRENRDLELKQMESGMKLVEFAATEAAKLRGTDREAAKQVVTYVSTLLPPAMACQMLNAIVVGARIADDLTEYTAQTKARLARTAPSAALACGENAREKQDESILAMSEGVAPSGTRPLRPTPPPPTPDNPQSPTTGPGTGPVPGPVTAAPQSTCEPPPPTRMITRLVTYYQIVEADDRPLAARIAADMPDDFPSAGIDLVSQRDPSKQKPEVRYYRADQETRAQYLACLLTEAYARTVKGPPVAFTYFSLADRYKNLPQQRIEVWFPRMPNGG